MKLVGILAATVASCAAAHVQPVEPADVVFVLSRSDDGFSIAPESLAPGETLTFVVGPGSDVVSVILPPAPGRSSSLESPGNPGLRIVRRDGDTLSLDVRGPDGSATGHGWSNTIDALRSSDIRVSVTDSERAKAFLIEDYARVSVSPGPVFNPFARVGMPTGADVVVETDTSERGAPPTVTGEAAFRVEKFPIVDLVIDGEVVGPAVVDTGAVTTTVSDSVLPEGADGEDWVRFDMMVSESDSVSMERQIVRHVRVVQQADPSGSRRPVVAMRVRLGEIQDTFEFTLADRSHLENELILGRNFLADVTLVDVGKQFIQPRYSPADAQ